MLLPASRYIFRKCNIIPCSMPFTFSHPAIILPLTRLPRRFYSFTGLIAGSVVPDFEYFFRMDIYSIYSHNIPGLFYFNLPVGILICFIFHGLVKTDLVTNLPAYFRERSEPVLRLDWPDHFRKNFLAVAISIVVGAASHLFWDGFTHHSGYFVNLLDYKAVNFSMFGLHLYLYNLLQHFSTLTGLYFICAFLNQMPVAESAGRGRIRYAYWIFVMLTAGIISTIRLTASDAGPDLFGKVILTIISACLLGIVLAPFFIPFRKRIALY